MATNSWAVIYCPKEGSPRTHKRWKKIKRYLDQGGVAYDYVQSEGAGSVERLAAMMTRTGYQTIVVVGGDAALNHALCGIMQTESPTGKHPALGIIPNGFGNDFGKYWGFSVDDYRKSIDALLHHRTRKVDVGVAHVSTKKGEEATYHFLNCVNIGVAASITNLKRKTHSLLGLKTLSYFFSALLLLFQRLDFKFHFQLNGEEIVRRAMTICIGSAHGYGLTPSAVPYNGQLDVTLASQPKITQLFHGLWLLITGRFLSHEGICVWRTHRIKFHSLGRAMVSLDGRVVHDQIKNLDTFILPEEIDFIIP